MPNTEIHNTILRFFLKFCSHDSIMPFIPLGLKETIEIDFLEAFSHRVITNLSLSLNNYFFHIVNGISLNDVIHLCDLQIKNHYHDDPNLYVDAINDISDTRQAARTPTRDLQGVNLLFRYYNLLYYVERRFFPYGNYLAIIVIVFLSMLAHTRLYCT